MINRIIPARAGFTTGPTSSTTSTADHPRSRGVYPGRPRSRRRVRGSSPLARGLRGTRVLCLRTGRIIPARAGFTGGLSRSCLCDWDHPRSRGVYRLPPEQTEIAGGSSPLARGLLAAYHAPVCVTGIIPARAGFTACPRSRRRSPADHPRSRGVYIRRRAVGPLVVGSSPLARGLLARAIRSARRIGIIPARAGFTDLRSVHLE